MCKFTNIVLLLLFILNWSPCSSQERRGIALVIGNNEYVAKNAELINPVNDAQDISLKLDSLNFEVMLVTNASRSKFLASVKSFEKKASKYNVALIYYAGHGIQYASSNYLVPIDTELESAKDIPDYCINMDNIVNRVVDLKCKLKVIVLDACRNNPFVDYTDRNVGNGLKSVYGTNDLLIAYSTNPNNTANDGDGRNSPYAKAFIHCLESANVPILKFFNNVGLEVQATTHKEQIPWETNSPLYEYEFCFNKDSSNSILTEKLVDLGLPSKTLWAGYNLGAKKPNEFGLKTDGRMKEKNLSLQEDTSHLESIEPSHVLSSKNDISTLMWGNDWVTPSVSQVEELINLAKWQWILYEGIYGFKVTGPNNNSIFIPVLEGQIEDGQCYSINESITKYNGEQVIDIENGKYNPTSKYSRCIFLNNYLPIKQLVGIMPISELSYIRPVMVHKFHKIKFDLQQ